jgi:hypothetical protein
VLRARFHQGLTVMCSQKVPERLQVSTRPPLKLSLQVFCPVTPCGTVLQRRSG